jgi:hypothetical protein
VNLFNIEDDAIKFLIVAVMCISLFASVAVVATNFAPDTRSEISEIKMSEFLENCKTTSTPSACRVDILKNFKIK